MFRCANNSESPALDTIRVRKNRPSILALSLALLMTALFVYVIASPALPDPEIDAASAEIPISTEVYMEGMELWFVCDVREADSLQARILAAKCMEEGGAGLILTDGSGYAVVREASAKEVEGGLAQSAAGLTLRLEGSAAELAAVTDAVRFLRAQATETGSLAGALEDGETDASSVQALLSVYETQGQRVLEELEALPRSGAPGAITSAVKNDVERLDAAIRDTAPASLRLVHAAACMEWMELAETLTLEGG